MVHPSELPSILMQQVGACDLDRRFLPADVDIWVSRFSEKETAAKAWKY